MTKRCMTIVILLSLVVLALPATASAQLPASWQVTLFDPQTGTVSNISSGGVSQLAALPNIPALGGYTMGANLSPDGRYLVFGVSDDTGGSSIYVADLTTQTCCRLLEDPLNAGLDIDWLGPISPDGTRVAVSTSSSALFSSGEINFTPLVTVFDLATGNVVAALDATTLASDFPSPIATFGDWKVDGLRLAPGCLGCEGVWQGTYQIWQPETDILSGPVEPFDIFQNKLPLTGEHIMGNEDLAYPTSGAFTAYVAPSNVVEYYSNASAAPQVVYFRQEDLYIERAEWVADGNGVLATHAGPFTMDADGFVDMAGDGPAFVALRDGTQLAAPATSTRNFLVGLPDGWLTQNPDTGLITHHNISIIPMQSVTLGSAQGFQVGQNFELGTSAIGLFPTIPPPAPIACAGFMNSRLAANSIAHVTPGPPNNLRDNPSAGATLVGEVPGDAYFVVLDGPVCADNMAWWQVNYQGVIGWTSEGQGSDYWLAPFSFGP